MLESILEQDEVGLANLVVGNFAITPGLDGKCLSANSILIARR